MDSTTVSGTGDAFKGQAVLVPDLLQPLELLLAELTAAEREQAPAASRQGRPTERRCRQFVLGRCAAHAAVRRALAGQAQPSCIEVLTGQEGQPVVWVDGVAGAACVSITHSGRLALACAWTGTPEGRRAGVDLERLRPVDVAQSRYAFSRRERALLARAPEGPRLAGLAAWTAKEAAWKALWPAQGADPAEVEVWALNLAGGQAVVRAPRGGSRLGVRVGMTAGPEGEYVFSVAR